jgi:hypothetical protein
MTTFETLILLAVIAVEIILALGLLVVGKKLDHIAEQHKSTWSHFDNVVSQLYGIKVEVGKTNAKIDGFIPWAKHLRQKADNLENAWACDITSIIGMLKRLENCLTQDINWGALTDEQRSEIFYRLTHPIVESPFKPPFDPTCETTDKEE